MSLSFYFDHNVDRRIVRGLRQRDVDLLTTEEDGTPRVLDDRLLERATELDRVFVSNDKDLVAIARRWQRERRYFPGLVRARQDNVSIGAMIDDLELIAKAMEPHEMANRVEYVPFPSRLR